MSYPLDLLPSDREFQQKYDKQAINYDIGIDWLFNAFYEKQDKLREQMVELLKLKRGCRVLDAGCGTGSDSVHIARRIGPEGKLFAMDISRGMLQQARMKLAEAQPEVTFLLGNASHLPLADGACDAVFHFGGLNVFAEKGKALSEMVRVTRTGGKVVVGDEGIAPWLRRRLLGRILIKANALYKHRPPLHLLPANARNVCVRWILGNAFYVIDFRVGDPPEVNLDLPIPGKGDTLRSRYYGRATKA